MRKLLDLFLTIFSPQMENFIRLDIIEIDVVFTKAVFQKIPHVFIEFNIDSDVFEGQFSRHQLEKTASHHIVKRMIKSFLLEYSCICHDVMPDIYDIAASRMENQRLYHEIFIRTNDRQHL